MTGNRAKDDAVPSYGWDFSLDYLDNDDESGRWVEVWGGDLPCRMAVRLGIAPSGRHCFTGLRIPPGEGREPEEVNSKTLRAISLGNIMRALREVAVTDDEMWTMPAHPEPFAPLLGSDELMRNTVDGLTRKTTAGKTLAEVLLGTAEPAKLTVRRGPKGDPEMDRRTLEHYQAARARGLDSSDAVAEVSVELYVSTSQVYRRMKRARQRLAGKGEGT